MKPFKILYLFFCLLTVHTALQAQMPRGTTHSIPKAPDPEEWRVTMKKLTGREFELSFHLHLEKGWHVFVKNKNLNKALIAPTFTFDKNEAIVLEGETDSKGIIESKKVEGIGTADMYSYNVVYVQKFIAQPGATISGKYTYQICNDEKAEAPKTKSFKFTVTDPRPKASEPAPAPKENCKWTFEAKKKKAGQYDLVAHLQLDKGWHVYAMKPGGDGTLLGTGVKFDKNANVKLTGAVKEKGNLISKTITGIKGKVNMYEGKVDYVQQATMKGKNTVTGEYTYQICNDKMCLPPVTKKFTITVK